MDSKIYTPNFERLHQLNLRAFLRGAINKTEEMEYDALLETMEEQARQAIIGVESVLMTSHWATVPESGLGLALNSLHLLRGTKPFRDRPARGY